MLDKFFLKISFFLLLNLCLFNSQIYAASEKSIFDDTLISQLRQEAEPKQGEQAVYPQAIHITKVADTIRPASVVVKGEEPDKNMTLARTVYQLVYADQRSIMLDSGMDYETHRTFGKTEEPFYHKNYQLVQDALVQANMILFTHYHADHIGGVIRSKHFDQLAAKTYVSDDTLSLMLKQPHKDTVMISDAQAKKFKTYQYNQFHRVAPGIVLFRAPGHTTDSKMLYIRLADGKEFIHSVDSGWSMENILTERVKNASWVQENNEQLLEQYRWLKHVINTEPNITVLCTHDNNQYLDLIRKGVLVGGLYIKE